MTWNCKLCKHPNVWWRDICEKCAQPSPGFEGQKPRESDELRQLREAIESVELDGGTVHLPPEHFRTCQCPDNYICMNTACPRAVKITC